MEKQICAICLIEKAVDEFKNMCAYGCSCTAPLVCACCVLNWLETSVVNAAGKNAPVSLSAWSCPVCRNQPAVATLRDQPIGRAPAFLTLPLADPVALCDMHDEWCQQFGTPPFPSDPRFGVLLTGQFATRELSLRINVFEYEAVYFCAIACVEMPNWFAKCALLLPVGFVATRYDDLHTAIAEQCLGHVVQCMALCMEDSVLAESITLHRNFNVLRNGAALLSHADAIRQIDGHKRDRFGAIGTTYMEFLDGLAPVGMSFADYYLSSFS